MAKPVSGNIYYDSAADRPRVDLRSGSKKLLTEDDSGGGGSITTVDSPNGSVTVTNPTGPTVSVQANFGTAANTVAQGNDTRIVNAVQTSRTITAGTGLTGGGDLSANRTLAADFGTGAGKVLQGNQAAGGDASGTLNNLTVDKARGLRETGGPTTLTMSAVADGQTLTRAGSTIVGGPSDGPKDSGHTDNVYFTDSADAFPSGWSAYRDGTGSNAVFGTATAVVATGTPTVGVDPYVPVAASGNDGSKINYNTNSRRPGWFYWQAPAEAGGTLRFAAFKKMASAMPADFVAVTRFAYGGDMDAGGSANNNGQLVWGVSVDSSGPRGGAVSGGGRILLFLRPDSATTGNMIATLAAANGTTSTTVSRSFSAIANAHTLGGWLKIVRRSSNVYGFIGNAEGSWIKIGTITSGTGSTGSTVLQWWTIAHTNRNDGTDNFSSYIGFDRILRYDQSSDVL